MCIGYKVDRGYAMSSDRVGGRHLALLIAMVVAKRQVVGKGDGGRDATDLSIIMSYSGARRFGALYTSILP